jgi:hypothetical protein
LTWDRTFSRASFSGKLRDASNTFDDFSGWSDQWFPGRGFDFSSEASDAAMAGNIATASIRQAQSHRADIEILVMIAMAKRLGILPDLAEYNLG